MTPAERTHEVLSRMLRDFLLLRPTDREALRRVHRLADEQITVMGWRSAPSVAQKLFIEHHFQTALAYWRVPGFYFDGELWRLHVRDHGALWLPYFKNKLMAGISIFRSPYDKRPRALTSRGLTGGTKAAPLPSVA